jgi:hypothetical protein
LSGLNQQTVKKTTTIEQIATTEDVKQLVWQTGMAHDWWG